VQIFISLGIKKGGLGKLHFQDTLIQCDTVQHFYCHTFTNFSHIKKTAVLPAADANLPF